jgi:hypothetical protein
LGASPSVSIGGAVAAGWVLRLKKAIKLPVRRAQDADGSYRVIG